MKVADLRELLFALPLEFDEYPVLLDINGEYVECDTAKDVGDGLLLSDWASRMLPEYTREPTPGDYEHRGGECPIHGENIVVARRKSALGPYFCVECKLEGNLASGEE